MPFPSSFEVEFQVSSRKAETDWVEATAASSQPFRPDNRPLLLDRFESVRAAEWQNTRRSVKFSLKSSEKARRAPRKQEEPKKDFWIGVCFLCAISSNDVLRHSVEFLPEGKGASSRRGDKEHGLLLYFNRAADSEDWS